MADLINFAAGGNNEEKKMFNKVKHDLELYREILLHLDSILKWEKKFYPAINFGITTIIFLMLWYLDLSILTFISLALLIVTVFDYSYPIISKMIFKPENWTGAKEKRFEITCNEICAIKCKIQQIYNCMFVTKKEQKTSMYYIITVVSLIVLAYIGATINNLLLSYLLILSITFYPGLSHYGFVQMVREKIGTFISTQIKCIKQKASDLKKTE